MLVDNVIDFISDDEVDISATTSFDIAAAGETRDAMNSVKNNKLFETEEATHPVDATNGVVTTSCASDSLIDAIIRLSVDRDASNIDNVREISKESADADTLVAGDGMK